MKRARQQEHEFSTDFGDFDISASEECNPANICGSDPSTWNSERLVRAFAALNKREQYILATRVWEERSYEEIGRSLGMTCKGASSAYYRVIQKLRASMEGGTKENGIYKIAS